MKKNRCYNTTKIFYVFLVIFLWANVFLCPQASLGSEQFLVTDELLAAFIRGYYKRDDGLDTVSDDVKGIRNDDEFATFAYANREIFIGSGAVFGKQEVFGSI